MKPLLSVLTFIAAAGAMPLGANDCPVERILSVNAEAVDYLVRTETRAGRSGANDHDGALVVRHQTPDRTELSGVPFGLGDGPAHMIAIGAQVFVRLPSKGWLSLPPGIPGLDPAAGNRRYGPQAIAQKLSDSHHRRVGPGPCPSGGQCVLYRFMDDGQPSTLFFAQDSCRVVAAVGVDEHGPQQLSIRYDPQQVNAPEKVESLQDHPMAMLQLLSGSNPGARRRPKPSPPSVPVESRPKLHHVLMMNGEAYSMEVAFHVQLGPYALFLLKDGAAAPAGHLSPAMEAPVDRGAGPVRETSTDQAIDAAATALSGADGALRSAPIENAMGIRNVGVPSDIYSIWMDGTGNGFAEVAYPPDDLLVVKGASQQVALAIKAQLGPADGQRPQFARALAVLPEVLVIDEPAAALDAGLADRIAQRINSVGNAKLLLTVHGAPLEAVQRMHAEMLLLGASASQLTTISLGQLLPRCRERTPGCVDKNRRAELRVLDLPN